MPYLSLNNKNIYFEVHGEGKPLVILNGIMMSHMSWYQFLPELTIDNKVILLDFLDQGKSDKIQEEYTQALQVEVVKRVLDELDIKSANIFGISYGGEIAQQFAIKHKSYVNKLVLFNTTAYTNPWLTDIGRGWISTAERYCGEAFYNVTIPVIYSPVFYTENIEWMNNRKKLLYTIFTKEFLDGMIRLIKSAESFDVREQLQDIKAKTLIVGSELDFITPTMEQQLIHSKIQGSKLIIIPKCGHASMYERPNEFLSILKGFISIEKEVKIV